MATTSDCPGWAAAWGQVATGNTSFALQVESLVARAVRNHSRSPRRRGVFWTILTIFPIQPRVLWAQALPDGGCPRTRSGRISGALRAARSKHVVATSIAERSETPTHNGHILTRRTRKVGHSINFRVIGGAWIQRRIERILNLRSTIKLRNSLYLRRDNAGFTNAWAFALLSLGLRDHHLGRRPNREVCTRLLSVVEKH